MKAFITDNIDRSFARHSNFLSLDYCERMCETIRKSGIALGNFNRCIHTFSQF